MTVDTENGEVQASANDNAATNDSALYENTPQKSSYWRSFRFVELVICFVTVLIGVSFELVDPYERPIPYQSLDDGTIIRNLIYDNPEEGESVGPTLLLVLVTLVPIFVQIALSILLTKKTPARERSDMIHNTLCVYFLGIGVTFTITNAAKRYTGYFRPIFFDLCKPSDDYQECMNESNLHGFRADRAGRLSFPSGHASLSACGCMLFSLFLERFFGKTAYSKKDTQQRQSPQPPWIRLVSVLCYAPMLLAIFIALSRVHDNHHHPADIVAGTLLGGIVASFVFGIWFF